MKHIILCLILTLASLCFAQDDSPLRQLEQIHIQDHNFPPRADYKHKAKIESDYDKFKDKTYVQVKNIPVDVGLYMFAAYSYKGTTAQLPEYITIGFQSHSRGWRFLRSRSFIVLADGERLDFGEAMRDSEVFRGGSVRETLGVTADLDQFLKIANAKTVEMRVGAYEYKLTPDQIDALKDFASRMKP